MIWFGLLSVMWLCIVYEVAINKKEDFHWPFLANAKFKNVTFTNTISKYGMYV